jgi:hypothetical protein
MTRFTQRIPFLQSLFPSSGAEGSAQPNEVTETVHLVHPWPGRAISLQPGAVQFVQRAGVASVTPADVIVSPSGGQEFWDEIIAMDLSHDSATARTIQLAMRNNVGQSTFIGRWSNQPSVLAAGLGGFIPVFGHPALGAPAAATVWVSPSRPLVVPAGLQLVVFGDTAGAPYTITMSMYFIQHLLHDPPLLY